MFLEDLKRGLLTDSLVQWQQWAQDFAVYCPEQCFLALHGDLGSGKTAFVKGLGKAWGLNDVRSPSFNLIDFYLGTRRLIHVDAYRLKPQQNQTLDLEDYLVPPFCLAVEWPENLPIQLDYTHHLYCAVVSEGCHSLLLK